VASPLTSSCSAGVGRHHREVVPDAPEALVAGHGPGQFLVELGLLTSHAVYLTPRVAASGTVTRTGGRLPPA